MAQETEFGELVTTGQRDGVALITMAAGPENRLDAAMLCAVQKAFEGALADPATRVIALCGEGENFSLGNGVDLVPAPELGALIATIEAAAVPVIVALSGYARGPAVALAMAGHFRIATPDAIFLVPESALGLMPAAGTMQRVTRIAGAQVALEMCLYGQRLVAEAALKCRLIDAIVDGELSVGITSFAREILARRFGARPASTFALAGTDMAGALAAVTKARKTVQQTRLVAPQRILDCIEAAYLLPWEAGLRFEAAALQDVMADPAGRGLRHIAVAERNLPLTLLAANPDGRSGLSAEGMEIAGSFRAAWLLAARALLQTGITEEVIDAAALAYGYAKGPFATEAKAKAKAGLAERLGDALIAEGARMLQAGRLENAATCDALATLATGFPRWRGGPLHAAEATGLTARTRAMEGWAALDPVWDIPEPLQAAAARGHWQLSADHPSP